jgi:hypothetical protein
VGPEQLLQRPVNTTVRKAEAPLQKIMHLLIVMSKSNANFRYSTRATKDKMTQASEAMIHATESLSACCNLRVLSKITRCDWAIMNIFSKKPDAQRT